MEHPNVNNLNGIPNFGHGFPDISEETKDDEPKKRGRKLSSQ